MSTLEPIAFDIETTGLDPKARLTVAGFAHEGGEWFVCQTGDREPDEGAIRQTLEPHSAGTVELVLATDEAAALEAMHTFVTERMDGDRHYLTAFNGETWNGGFDLPFLRTTCARHGHPWPFADLAYVDIRTTVDRFMTGDVGDLEGVFDILVGGNHPDPFDTSEEAVAAYRRGAYEEVLLHNLADIQRTRALAVLADRYVPRSDFRMKNLAPPSIDP